VTQSNAAGAEETASAAQELSGQTDLLRSAVKQLNAFTGIRAAAAADGARRRAEPVPLVPAGRNGSERNGSDRMHWTTS